MVTLIREPGPTEQRSEVEASILNDQGTDKAYVATETPVYEGDIIELPDSRVNCSMLSSTAKPKRRKGRATGRSSTPLSCSPSGNTSPPRTPHTTPACLIIDTPLLGLDDPQLDPELQEARETIPAALYDYLALEQDGGQMIIADNTKFMPDIEPLKDRCKLIVFTKREGEGRYGFLLDAQDEDLIDLEETDDN